jgi:hypothetical protein
MLNYRQYLKDGGESVLQPVKWIGSSFYKCQKCDKPTNEICLIDVTSLGTITEGKTWVCDQCITDWKRAKTPIDPTDEFFVPEEWDVRFLEKVGCFEKEYIQTKKRAVKKVKTRYNDIRKDPKKAAERVKIEERYGNPASLPKVRIRANNKEESTVSAIPANSQIFIDGQKVTENTNTLTFSTFNKGKYKLKIVSDYHLDYEGEIDAY